MHVLESTQRRYKHTAACCRRKMRSQGLMATLMLDARLHACPRAAPLGLRQSAWRPPVVQHVRCLASKRPEEKSWVELAGNANEKTFLAQALFTLSVQESAIWVMHGMACWLHVFTSLLGKCNLQMMTRRHFRSVPATCTVPEVDEPCFCSKVHYAIFCEMHRRHNNAIRCMLAKPGCGVSSFLHSFGCCRFGSSEVVSAGGHSSVEARSGKMFALLLPQETRQSWPRAR